MEWSDLFPLLAVSAGSLGAAAVALAIAAVFRLDRRWFSRAVIHPPHDTIDRLAALADVAKAQGLLTAESRVDADAEPLLARGLRLAVDGIAPDEIARQLNETLDAQSDAPSWVARILRLAHLSQAHTIAAVVLFGLMIANRFEPELTPAFTAGIAVLAFLALSTVACIAASLRPARAAHGAAPGLLSATMQIVGATLIGSGCDGGEVRGRLSALLPPSHRASEALTRAA